MVALGDAWQTGATGWPAGKRLAFANDALNLLTVAASANRQKGDADAASWLPANKSYRCGYVARQVAVKAKYRLWVTAAERDAVTRVLRTCPAQVAPAGGAPTLAPVGASAPRPTSAPPPTATRTTQPPTSGDGGTDPRFATCEQAKARGYGPYHQGADPEYSWYRDADHDGIVCE